jgi:hypothetical protein
MKWHFTFEREAKLMLLLGLLGATPILFGILVPRILRALGW